MYADDDFWTTYQIVSIPYTADRSMDDILFNFFIEKLAFMEKTQNEFRSNHYFQKFLKSKKNR